ncbi:MAG: isoprenylcysteine carboxylmethyltransferase family protein [Cytophagales bacterium]|nr:isoprenylcysteine carboxylmethyltransferase family protein [Cytophagales bacterium]
MFNNVFKIVYFVLFMLAFVVRKVFTASNRKREFIVEKKSPWDVLLLTFDGIGMLIPLVYVFGSGLDFADYPMPQWVGWAGVVLFMDAILLLYLSHAHLGKNWSPVLGIQKDHTLVTSGIYAYIRHPMYAAHLLWAIAQMLMLHNWIAGFSFIAVMIPHYLIRVGKEEQMMIDRFGEEYRAYMKTTGRVVPKFK